MQISFFTVRCSVTGVGYTSIFLLYRVSDCSIRLNLILCKINNYYALKLHQNSETMLINFAPPLFLALIPAYLL